MKFKNLRKNMLLLSCIVGLCYLMIIVMGYGIEEIKWLYNKRLILILMIGETFSLIFSLVLRKYELKEEMIKNG